MAEARLPTPPDEAMIDLLIKQMNEVLEPAEQRVLDRMDRAAVSAYQQDFERAAAAICLTTISSQSETPSAELRAQIELEAYGLFFGAPGNDSRMPRERLSKPRRSLYRVSTGGWFIAAASLVLAAVGWLRTPEPMKLPLTTHIPVVLPPIPVPSITMPPPPTLAQEREAMLVLPGAVIVALGATKDRAAEGVIADAVWDPSTQRGFLHVAGLKPNDPRIEQYEAWIFDAKRDKRYPLAAGLFDVPADSNDFIVPIRASLPIVAVQSFALTLEKPSGVVVPSLEHVLALGAIS